LLNLHPWDLKQSKSPYDFSIANIDNEMVLNPTTLTVIQNTSALNTQPQQQQQLTICNK
jgi:hypothetical protein